MQGREKEVVVLIIVRSNDTGTRISKRTSRYETGVNGSQEKNGRMIYEQFRCQDFCISHSTLRDETGARLYTCTPTLYLLLLLCIAIKLPL